MSIPVGGRGKKVPYGSSVVRVPDPVKSDVEKLIDSFYGSDACADSRHLARAVSYYDLKEAAAAVLSQKKSAAKSMALLLKALFPAVTDHPPTPNGRP
jgi:hypothetical protein